MSNVPRCEPTYRGECKQCGHLIERTLDLTVSETDREERIRCARCGQINLLPVIEPEDGDALATDGGEESGPVTEEEELRMREEFSEFLRSENTRSNMKRLHLPKAASGTEPLGGWVESAGLQRKPVAVFPIAYAPFCERCLREWRSGR